MPETTLLSSPEPGMWCTNICEGAEAHDILDFFLRRFKENAGNGILSFDGAQGLDIKLAELGTLLHNANCDRLYAYAIHVAKQSAFLNIEDKAYTFVERLHAIIQKVWNDGYNRHHKKDKTGASSNGDDIFDPNAFLEGWVYDLRLVKNELLPIYIQILACDGLGSQPKFNEAIVVFCNRLFNNSTALKPSLIDACGESLIRCVLEPLLETNRMKVIECLPYAVDIAVAQASDNSYTSVKALRNLIEHLIKLKIRGHWLKRSHSNGFHREVLSNILEKLSKAFRNARRAKQFNLCQEFAHLIPIVGGWERDQHLKVPDKLYVELHFSDSSQICKGIVKDIDKNGHCYHIQFDDISETAAIKDHKRKKIKGCPIPIADLRMKDKHGSAWKFSKALAIFDVPAVLHGKQSAQLRSEILPIRGWSHKPSDIEHAGAVVWVKTPPIKNIKDLIPISAMEGEAEDSDETDIPIIKKEFSQKHKTLLIAKLPFDVPFDQGPMGLIKGIEQFFEKISDAILFNKMYILLWTTQKPISPVPERNIDALIRQFFKEYVESRGGSLSCQEDVGLGLCDYIVSRGNDKVVIELKRSCHQQLKQGLETELPTLMVTNGAKYGIFLMFAFNAAFKKGSSECKNLIRLREKITKKMNLNIRIIIINCDKQEPASKRKATLVPGDGFQQY
jgi:hypothetical protein